MVDIAESIVNINSIQEFNDLIINYKTRLIVIDFWAPWCGPCKAFHPVYESAHLKWKKDLIFAKVNTEQAPDVAQQLGIQGVPTIGFVKGQKLVESTAGALRRPEFDALVDKVLRNIRNERKNASALYS